MSDWIQIKLQVYVIFIRDICIKHKDIKQQNKKYGKGMQALTI